MDFFCPIMLHTTEKCPNIFVLIHTKLKYHGLGAIPIPQTVKELNYQLMEMHDILTDTDTTPIPDDFHCQNCGNNNNSCPSVILLLDCNHVMCVDCLAVHLELHELRHCNRRLRFYIPMFKH